LSFGHTLRGGLAVDCGLPRPEEFPEWVDLAVVPEADHGLKVPARGALSQDEALAVVVEATLEWLLREVIGNP